MEFPLAERELTRLAKNKRMYLLRVLPAIVATAIAAVVAPFTTQGTLFNGAEALSGVFTWLATVFQLTVLGLVVPVTASGQIAREKEERTLGLLMLADLRGGDVYLSKFTAVTVNAWLLILSTLPLLAIGAFLGGVTVPTAAARVLVALACAAAIAAMSLFASALVEKVQSALGLAMTFFILFVLLTAALDAMWRDVIGTPVRFSPFRAILVNDSSWTGLSGWAPATLLSLAIAALLGLWTARLLPRLAQDRPARGRRPRMAPAPPPAPPRATTGVPAESPPAAPSTLAKSTRRWSARHDLWRRLFLGSNEAAWLLRSVLDPNTGRTFLLVAVSLLALAFGSCLGVFLVAALIAHSIVTPVRTFFDEGGFDDLLLAAADARVLATGLYRVLLLRTAFFIVPLWLATGIASVFLMFVNYRSDGHAWFSVLTGGVIAALQVAFVVALAASEAFRKRKASSAVTATAIGFVALQFAAGLVPTVLISAVENGLFSLESGLSPGRSPMWPTFTFLLQCLLYIGAIALQFREYKRTFARMVG